MEGLEYSVVRGALTPGSADEEGQPPGADPQTTEEHHGCHGWHAWHAWHGKVDHRDAPADRRCTVWSVDAICHHGRNGTSFQDDMGPDPLRDSTNGVSR
jgi:hypothetical protein